MSLTRSLKALSALVGAVFFLTPLALLATGYRSHDFENHALAPAPALSQGWNIFTDATSFLIQHLPLRQHAVNANTWIDLHLFHVTPQYGQNGVGGVGLDQALPGFGNPDQDKSKESATTVKQTGSGTSTVTQPPETENQVVPGVDGWYFLSGVFNRACNPFIPWTTAAARWSELLDVIRASGRRAILVVPPDKSSVYGQYVAANTPDLACSKPGETALWNAIDSPSARAAGIIGLRSALRAQARASQTPLYFKTDSHWNELGSLSLTRTVLSAFSPTIRLPAAQVDHQGTTAYTGDLLKLLGITGVSEQAPVIAIKRPAGAPDIAVPTVEVGDSYGEVALTQTQDFFAHPIDFLLWDGDSATRIADGIADAHDVILETVEREFDYRTSDVAYITPKFIALVKRTLAAHPLPRR